MAVVVALLFLATAGLILLRPLRRVKPTWVLEEEESRPAFAEGFTGGRLLVYVLIGNCVLAVVLLIVMVALR